MGQGNDDTARRTEAAHPARASSGRGKRRHGQGRRVATRSVAACAVQARRTSGTHRGGVGGRRTAYAHVQHAYVRYGCTRQACDWSRKIGAPITTARALPGVGDPYRASHQNGVDNTGVLGVDLLTPARQSLSEFAAFTRKIQSEIDSAVLGMSSWANMAGNDHVRKFGPPPKEDRTGLCSVPTPAQLEARGNAILVEGGSVDQCRHSLALGSFGACANCAKWLPPDADGLEWARADVTRARAINCAPITCLPLMCLMTEKEAQGIYDTNYWNWSLAADCDGRPVYRDAIKRNLPRLRREARGENTIGDADRIVRNESAGEVTMHSSLGSFKLQPGEGIAISSADENPAPKAGAPCDVRPWQIITYDRDTPLVISGSRASGSYQVFYPDGGSVGLVYNGQFTTKGSFAKPKRVVEDTMWKHKNGSTYRVEKLGDRLVLMDRGDRGVPDCSKVPDIEDVLDNTDTWLPVRAPTAEDFKP